jgi:hypothetical protein
VERRELTFTGSDVDDDCAVTDATRVAAATEGPDPPRAEQLGDAELAELPPMLALGREHQAETVSLWSARRAAVSGRVASAASWVLMTSLAADANEATTTLSSPRRSSMSGAPSRRARSRMARCGNAPTKWCMLPMTGNRHGPGGRLVSTPCLCGLSLRRRSGSTRMVARRR